MHWFRLVFALTIAGAASAASDPLEATMGRIDQVAATFKGLSADVRTLNHVAVINEDTVDNGTMLVKRPKPHDIRMRLDIQPPNPKKALFSGRKAQVYYPNSNSLDEYDLGKNKDVMNQFLLLGFGSNSRDLKSAYSIKLGGPETVAGKKTTRIELIPKSPEMLQNLTKVELWISDEDGLTVQQKLHERGGDYWLATYTNMKLNPPIADSAMNLDLPKNVHRQQPQK